ncbi:hypothetical protein PIB30_001606 [Stylosanthes scabra]|uniref:Uncharacterized protein n=1 Tax=Stylosanthes scabra TaxID=79078 RepID=A0ABU6S3A6_9FABA|nr:hypothetical protein [Stylosanthes scabra]
MKLSDDHPFDEVWCDEAGGYNQQTSYLMTLSRWQVSAGSPSHHVSNVSHVVLGTRVQHPVVGMMVWHPMGGMTVQHPVPTMAKIENTGQIQWLSIVAEEHYRKIHTLVAASTDMHTAHVESHVEASLAAVRVVGREVFVVALLVLPCSVSQP